MKKTNILLINKYKLCTVALIILVFLYQLPIAVILNKTVRMIGLVIILGCIIAAIILNQTPKMWLLVILSAGVSVCLYYTCWSIYPEFADSGNLFSKSVQYFFFWGYLFIGVIFQKAAENQKMTVYRLWLLVNIVTMITTIIGEVRYPGVSRLLAGIATEEESDFYKQFNIGSYNTVYGALMALPIWCYLRSSTKGPQKVIYTFLIAFACVFFVVTEYGFALAGAVAILLWYFFLSEDNSVKQFVKLFVFVLALVLLLVSMNAILDYLIDYTNARDMGSFYRRLVAIKQFLQTGRQTGDILKRNEHYLTSIEAFLKHPVVGGIVDLKHLKLGRHSELFDLMASLGIWGVAFLIYMLRYYYTKCIMPYRNTRIFKYQIVMLITFIYLLVVNLVFSFHNVSFALFVLPVLFCGRAFQKRWAVD